MKAARERKCVVCGLPVGEEPYLAAYGSAGSRESKKQNPEAVVHFKRECMDKYLKRARKRS